MFAMIHSARRTLGTALVAAAFLGISACGGGEGPTGPSTKNLIGTWALESVDDEELPEVIHRGAYLDPNTGIFYNNFVFSVEGGYMEIREDETFYIALDVSVLADGQTGGGVIELEGFWDQVEDQIVLRVQFPFVGRTTMYLEDGMLHTDADVGGFGEENHLHFKR